MRATSAGVLTFLIGDLGVRNGIPAFMVINFEQVDMLHLIGFAYVAMNVNPNNPCIVTDSTSLLLLDRGLDGGDSRNYHPLR